MKTVKLLSTVLLCSIVLFGCENNPISPQEGMLDGDLNYQLSSIEKNANKGIKFKATGFVEIEWKGAAKGGEMGNKPEALLTFFDFNASKKDDNAEARGEIAYLVLETDLSPHREIRAEVKGLHIDKVSHKAWIIGNVISDSKGCLGNGSGGHDSGCADDHTDGGCSDDHTDGGCSDDHTDGGCSGDDTSHDSGCSHDDTDAEGGCSDGSHEETDHGGMGGNGGSESDKGNPLSGKNCRLGQIIAVKLHDGGTPGTDGDGITWKWFDPENLSAPCIEEWNAWPHLCKKTIIGGNLVIH